MPQVLSLIYVTEFRDFDHVACAVGLILRVFVSAYYQPERKANSEKDMDIQVHFLGKFEWQAENTDLDAPKASSTRYNHLDVAR
ncbi:hypothetical protein CC2G_003681 [Coprinopsis cinerea AmutBmut pab1-1]|nr:hypothetical protein CC2G_003681 [Coprinopsis cinerea AmutBmut pab1-1]